MTVLLILKWLSIVSVSAAIIGGVLDGYFDYRKSIKEPTK